MIVGHSERQVENVRTANCERWSAASGYVVILFGIAGAAFERGGPPLNAPVEETLAFFSKYRNEVTAGIQMVFQGVQVALAVASNHPVEPTLAALFSNATLALSVIAYVPMAVMLAAVAVVSLRDRAFPSWLGWLSAVAAMAHVLMSIGLVVEGGPLVPGGTPAKAAVEERSRTGTTM